MSDLQSVEQFPGHANSSEERVDLRANTGELGEAQCQQSRSTMGNVEMSGQPLHRVESQPEQAGVQHAPKDSDLTTSQAPVEDTEPSTAQAAIEHTEPSPTQSSVEIHNQNVLTDGGAALYPPTSNVVPDISPPLSPKESLGIVGCLSIIGGYVGVLGILGFLAFLWFGYGLSPEAADATYAWRQIAVNDWMTQAITLCALALRFTISVQSSVCTSMIAALILEKRFSRRSQVAYFSILRTINDGPRKLVELMLSSMTPAILMFAEFWLVLLMTIVTLALQFSSTILLSDMGDFVIVGNVNRTQVPSLITYEEEDFDFRLSSGGFFNRMPIYQTFAEAPSESNAFPDSYGLSDTGLVQRGFLPLADSDSRKSLRQFDGNMMVMNSRVACMRPLMDVQYTTFETEADVSYQMITGQLYYGSSLRDAQTDWNPTCSSPECREASFGCSLPIVVNRADKFESMPCLVGGVGGQLWGIDLFPKWNSTDMPWAANQSIHLVFSTNMRRIDWDVLPKEGPLGLGNPYAEWQSYEPLPGRHINVTACFSAFNMARKNVHVAAHGILREPSTKWALTSQVYNTSDVQNFMGVDIPNRSHDERGILTMNIIGEPDDGPPDSPAHTIITLDGQRRQENHSVADLTTRVLEEILDYELTQAKDINSSTLLCYSCDGNGYLEHPVLAMLYSSIIAETGRAANAIQSFMTITGFSWYDAYLNSLGELQWADLIMTKVVRTPGPCSEHGCGGFISVTTLVGIHLVYVAVITILYVKQVRYSRYDNVWHTISQLVSDDLKVPLVQANNSRDVVVEAGCRMDGEDYRVKLGRIPETGRIEIVKLGILNKSKNV